MGQPIRILADDDMALLQPQHALGLDAEGLYASGAAGGHQRIPQRLALARRDMDLIAELADEPDAEQPGRYAGDAAEAHAHVGEGLGPRSTSWQTLGQHLARAAGRRY